MIALILAAGKGSRLYPSTQYVPKPLVQLTEGVTLLEYQINLIKKIGIKKIQIVVGFLGEEIVTYSNQLDLHDIESLEIIVNKDYAIGSLHSFLLGIEELNEPFFVFNADHVFEKNIFKVLNKFTETQRSICFYDSYRDLNSGDAKILEEDGEIIQISKTKQNFNKGYVGISMFTKDTLDLLKKHSKLLDQNNSLSNQISYEEVINALCNAGERPRGIDIGQIKWINVNSPKDLTEARTLYNR